MAKDRNGHILAVGDDVLIVPGMSVDGNCNATIQHINGEYILLDVRDKHGIHICEAERYGCELTFQKGKTNVKYLLIDAYNGGEPFQLNSLDEVRSEIATLVEDQGEGYYRDQLIDGLQLFEIGEPIRIEVETSKVEVRLNGELASEPDFATILAANPPLPRESAKQYCARIGACG